MQTHSLLLVILTLIVAGCSSQSQVGSTPVIQMGKIEKKERLTGPMPDGTLAGGYHGLLYDTTDSVANPSLRSKNVKRAASDRPVYLYTIVKKDDRRIRFATEKDFLERADCVAIESGPSMNIRRIDDALCRTPRGTPPSSEALISARQCQLAKRQLLIAQTDQQMNMAAQQVAGLCQFSP